MNLTNMGITTLNGIFQIVGHRFQSDYPNTTETFLNGDYKDSLWLKTLKSLHGHVPLWCGLKSQ